MANDKKSELLGTNYSSASSSLRKQIIFHLAGVLGLLDCYRCGEAIELDRFSIEHKDAWMSAEDPVASFFDMNNIAFSHLNPCNTGAASHPKRLTDAEREASKEREKQWQREYSKTPERQEAQRNRWQDPERKRWNRERMKYTGD